MNVVDTRTPDEDGFTNGYKMVDKAINWYCYDYRIRRRKCQKCGRSTVTLEIAFDDFKGALREAEQGNWNTD